MASGPAAVGPPTPTDVLPEGTGLHAASQRPPPIAQRPARSHARTAATPVAKRQEARLNTATGGRNVLE